MAHDIRWIDAFVPYERRDAMRAFDAPRPMFFRWSTAVEANPFCDLSLRDQQDTYRRALYGILERHPVVAPPSWAHTPTMPPPPFDPRVEKVDPRETAGSACVHTPALLVVRGRHLTVYRCPGCPIVFVCDVNGQFKHLNSAIRRWLDEDGSRL